MSITKWRDVPGTFSTDLARVGDKLIDAEENEGASFLLPLIPDATEEELLSLVIEFHSSGYDDPGKFHGPPERCYPPEGDDEREIIKAWIEREDGQKVELDKEQREKLYEPFYEEIEQVEVCHDRE